MTNKKYDVNDFARDIKTLNEQWGNKTLDPETMSEDYIWESLYRQYEITLEEIKEIGEGIKARSHNEVLDGIVDGLFTMNRFISLTEKLYDLSGAMQAVADNNALKTSTRHTHFEQYGYKAEYKVVATQTKSGATYYCLKNDSGKVCKYNGFPVVELASFIY